MPQEAKHGQSDSSSEDSDDDSEVDDRIRQATQIDYLQQSKKSTTAKSTENGEAIKVDYSVTDHSKVVMATDYRSLKAPDLFRRRMQEKFDALCEKNLRFRKLSPEPEPDVGVEMRTKRRRPPALFSSQTMASLLPQASSEELQQAHKQSVPPNKKLRLQYRSSRLVGAQSDELRLLAVDPATLLANSGVACHRQSSGSANAPS